MAAGAAEVVAAALLQHAADLVAPGDGEAPRSGGAAAAAGTPARAAAAASPGAATTTPGGRTAPARAEKAKAAARIARGGGGGGDADEDGADVDAFAQLTALRSFFRLLAADVPSMVHLPLRHPTMLQLVTALQPQYASRAPSLSRAARTRRWANPAAALSRYLVARLTAACVQAAGAAAVGGADAEPERRGG